MKTYYLDIGGKKKGPYTLNQLRAMWARGAINARNFYCEEGGDKWRTLEMMQSVLETSGTKPEDAPEGTGIGKWCLMQFEKLRRLFKS